MDAGVPVAGVSGQGSDRQRGRGRRVVRPERGVQGPVALEAHQVSHDALCSEAASEAAQEEGEVPKDYAAFNCKGFVKDLKQFGDCER